MTQKGLTLQKVHCGECGIIFEVRIGHEQSDIEAHAIGCPSMNLINPANAGEAHDL
jgi:hypothetical protein